METEQNSHRRMLCIGMILLQGVLYGLNDCTSKLAYRELPLYAFLTARYCIATAFLFLLFGKKIIREVTSVSPKHYVVPAFCMAFSFIFCNMALEVTAATNMAFLRSLSALVTPLLLLVFFRVRYKSYQLPLQLFLLVGLYLLCAKGGLSVFGLGEIYSLLAAVLISGALVFGADALRYISAVTLSALQAAFAIFICLFLALFRGDFAFDVATVRPVHIAILLYASIVCTVGGYLLQNMALRSISSSTVSMAQCAYPVMASLFSFFLLQEQLSFAGMVGGTIILSCVFLESFLGKRTPAIFMVSVAPRNSRNTLLRRTQMRIALLRRTLIRKGILPHAQTR